MAATGTAELDSSTAIDRAMGAKLSGWRRLSIVLTVIWVLLALSLVEASRFSSEPYPFGQLIVSGIIPPAFLWGAWWVWRGFSHGRGEAR